MSFQRQKYEIELWYRGQTRIGEISRYCRNIKFSLVRNGVDSLSFDIDLKAFEEYCERINEDPSLILDPLNADIKVKRNGQYLFGVFLVEDPGEFSLNGGQVHLEFDGYLNLLADRYVTRSYEEIESTDIAWDLIFSTQDQANGDLGITVGQMYETGIPRNRNYDDQNVKEGVVNLTSLIDGNFDFRFSHNRVFETFQFLGNERPDVIVDYPATRRNIGAKDLKIPRSAANLYNRVIAKGSGFGDETIRHVADNAASQAGRFLKERIITYNDISVLETLIEHAEADVAMLSELLVLPKPVVNGDQFDLNSIAVGDRIVVNQSLYKMFLMEGYYRIEQIDVSLDENMAEEITLTLDNYGL